MQTISRPRKFQGPNRQYMKVEYNGSVQNVMLDDAVLNDWEDIDSVTIGEQTYSQRSATEADVTEGKAEKVGDLLHENWTRLECIDYTTFSRKKKVAQSNAEIVAIEKKFSIADVSLEAATA